MQHARAGITEESQLLPHIFDHLARIGTSTSSSVSGVSCESLVVALGWPSSARLAHRTASGRLPDWG
jgi:hypothetical protein